MINNTIDNDSEPAVYGLLGRRLGHSYSAVMFNNRFADADIDAVYRLFEVDNASDIGTFLDTHRYLAGLNVTVPYKESILPFLDSLSQEAADIGAVNVVAFRKDGKLAGYNTDCYGFQYALMPMLRPDVRNALILGTGGASKAVVYALSKLGIKHLLVSRSDKHSCMTYADITPEVMDSCKLIVNTTPLGMWPDVNSRPDIPYELITPGHICFDLVYNPETTQFMSACSANGALVCNGLEMLRLQAEGAWSIWNS